MVQYYKDGLPGDSPELMPLDSHLFADAKEGVARNVAFSFFLDDNDSVKYSLRTPKHVFDALERTLASGCPSKERMKEDMLRIPKTLQQIVDTGGAYIEEENSNKRKGVRGEAKQDYEKALKLIDPAVQRKFEAMLDTMCKAMACHIGKPRRHHCRLRLETEKLTRTSEKVNFFHCSKTRKKVTCHQDQNHILFMCVD